MTRAVIFFCIFLCVLLGTTSFSADNYNFMVLNFRGSQEIKKWGLFSQYLSEKMGTSVTLRGIKLSGMLKRANRADIILTNPVLAVKIMDMYEFEAIATQNHKQLGPRFAGVIITHKDSSITTIAQLAGKKVGVVHLTNAAGGFLFQAKELLKVGLVPEKDFSNFKTIPNQDAIIAHVLDRTIDAGFIRTGQLENYKKQGGDISQIKILNIITEGLQFPRSTDIYPHWGLLVNKKSISEKEKEKIQKAIFALDENDPVCVSANLKGFSPPGNYDKLKKVMRELKVYEFKK